MISDAEQTEQGFTAGPPAVGDGLVIIYGDGFGANVFAFDAASGAPEWTSGDFLEGESGSGVNIDSASGPAVGDGQVYITGSDGEVAFSERDGRANWLDVGGSGGAGRIGVIHDDDLFAGDVSGSRTPILAASDGHQVGTYQSYRSPVFSGGTIIETTGAPTTGFGLQAVDLETGKSLWSVPSSADFTLTPITLDGATLVTTNEDLDAYSVTTGGLMWSEDVGYPIGSSLEITPTQPFASGLAASGTTVVVPASDHLVAYTTAPTA